MSARPRHPATRAPGRSLPGPGLSARAELVIRRIAVGVVCGLAVVAAALSYTGLRELALRAGIHPWLAWTWPLVLDGLGLVGGLSVLSAGLQGLRVWYPWMLTMLGVAGSIVGNITVSPPDIKSRFVFAAPPIVLALSLEALLRIYRNQIARRAGDAQPQVTAAPRSGPVNPAGPADTPPAGGRGAPGGETPAAGQPSASPQPAASPTAQPKQPPKSGSKARRGPTLKQRVRELLAAEPDLTVSEVAQRLGQKDPSYVRKLIKEVKAETGGGSAGPSTPPARPDNAEPPGGSVAAGATNTRPCR